MNREASLRMLFALSVSIALHLSFIYGVGDGPAKSAATQTILARLVPQAVISASMVAGKSPPGGPCPETTLDRTLGTQKRVRASSRGSYGRGESLRTPAQFPEAQIDAVPEAVPEIPAKPEESVLPRADVPLLVDTRWYTAKDLDLYPQVLEQVQPAYPPSAADASGEVLVQLMIDEFGAVNEATVVKAEPEGYFEESALQAFGAARFSPAQRDGHAVRSRVVVKVRFAPQTQASAER